LRDAAEVSPVLGRDLVQILDRLEAAGARHIHRDDGRVAGDVAAKKFGGEPPIKVVAAARAVADVHAHSFAAVEVGDRVGGGGRRRECGEGRDRHQPG
jgi:hypothetical protein